MTIHFTKFITVFVSWKYPQQLISIEGVGGSKYSCLFLWVGLKWVSKHLQLFHSLLYKPWKHILQKTNPLMMGFWSYGVFIWLCRLFFWNFETHELSPINRYFQKISEILVTIKCKSNFEIISTESRDKFPVHKHRSAEHLHWRQNRADVR